MDERFERGWKVAAMLVDSPVSPYELSADEVQNFRYFVSHTKQEHAWDGSERRMRQQRAHGGGESRRKPEEAARDAKEEPVPEWQADELEWRHAVVRRCTRCDGKKRDSTCGTCVRLVLQFEKGSP